MTNLIIGINAKYIHTNVAIRLLDINSEKKTNIIDFTIKDDIEFIISTILSNNPNTIAFSCYIWNIEIIKKIIPILKEKNNNIKIILGGPEVSYDIKHFFDTLDIDFIIRNEGEVTYDMLLNHIDDNTLDINEIPNLVYKDESLQFTKLQEIEHLDKIHSPYQNPDDIEHLKNKIQYLETSRGCPFNCSFCMSSLEKKVRFFDISRIKKDILYLLKHDTKVFKFLDRTFNINKKYALEVFDFIISNYKENVSFQFEITGDILDPEVIDYLNINAPENFIRFEIGIQSTNLETNKLVDRIQNNEKLFSNIRKIQEGKKIDLHLDLIAGLPREDYKSFIKTFNDVFELKPKELQLGFLKLLRGTKLRIQSKIYDYKFDPNAPYELISNDSISCDELDKIHLVEESLEKFWNSSFLVNTLNYIFTITNEYYDVFYDIAYEYSKQWKWHKYQLHELFERFYIVTKDKYPNILSYMKLDYLSYFKVKPKRWWNERIEKKQKNEVLTNYYKTNKEYTLNDLFKYAIVEKYLDKYLICVYKGHSNKIIIFG